MVIPTYNNDGTIAAVVADTLKACKDVIVVNDGSTDHTSSILHSIEGITLVEYDQNRGKGHALRCGFERALQMGFAYAITLDADYHLGIMKAHYLTYYTLEHRDYGFWESIPAGITYGWETLKGYVSDLQYVFSKKGAQSVGSFGTIGNLFPAVWDWQSFWQITAFISLMLAFMNILPIPGLDGGHIFFLLVEAVTRRPPSEKFMERAQYVGMAIILALMALAIFNDIVKFVF